MKKVLLIIGMVFCAMFLFGCQVVDKDEEAALAEIIAEEEDVTEEEATNLAGDAIATGRMKWLSCVDDDNGKDYDVKSEVTVKYLYKGKEKTRVRTDKCSYGGRVKEYYCKETLRLAIDGHLCELGCEDGICKTNDVEVQPPPGGVFNQTNRS